MLAIAAVALTGVGLRWWQWVRAPYRVVTVTQTEPPNRRDANDRRVTVFDMRRPGADAAMRRDALSKSIALRGSASRSRANPLTRGRLM
jgi:hypothetical protein